MLGRTNAGGGAPNKSTIIVTAPTGSTVTCTNGAITKTAPEKDETWKFSGLDNGTWTVTASKDGQTATKSVTISRLEVEYVTINYNTIPEFTFTGDYETVDDDGTPITTSQGNWNIRLLTSGTFIPLSLNGAENGIDVFAVGGGGAGGSGAQNRDSGWCGGGGAGGYTKTVKAISLLLGVEYQISIGSGGTPNTSHPYSGNPGGETSAFGLSVDGGTGGTTTNGGSGGSGGGGVGHGSSNVGYPGTDGGVDGSDGEAGKGSPGKGQGTTTMEFGESEKTVYANGGTGKLKNTTYQTRPNHGDGGRGAATFSSYGSAGSSGIVIIRNHREGAA